VTTGDDLEERLVWILGSPRSGSTWLLGLLKASPRVIPIEEPAIGSHIAIPVTSITGVRPERVAPDRFRVNDLREDAPDYFFARRYERVWRPLLRDLILGRLAAQVADAAAERKIDDPICVLKEPHGSIGADVLMAALPRSRMIFLLRDGRDVIDSEVDAASAGSWAMSILEGYAPIGEEDREAFLRERAHAWLARTAITQGAYQRHPADRRTTIRYEDLLQDAEEHLGALDAWLDLGLEASEIRDRVGKTRFERLGPEARGRGRFARAATPGLWRQNLRPSDQALLEEMLGPKLRELGYDVA
jgi:hypothetical protein